VTQIKKQFEPKPYINKHIVLPIFGVAPAEEGWVEKPGNGRIKAIRSIVFSDSSSRRYYRLEPVKPKNRKKRRAVARDKRKKSS
jgi:hypothetical protein